MEFHIAGYVHKWVISGLILLSAVSTNAALFDDNEARTAILDLRQRI